MLANTPHVSVTRGEAITHGGGVARPREHSPPTTLIRTGVKQARGDASHPRPKESSEMDSAIPALHFPTSLSQDDCCMSNRWEAAGAFSIAEARPDCQSSTFRARAELGAESLTLVNGPAGSGKSTLLAGWYAQLERSSEHLAVWIDLDTAQFRDRPVAQILERTTDSGKSSTPLISFVDGADRLNSDDLAAIAGLAGATTRFVLASRSDLDPPIEARDVRIVGPEELRLSDDDVRRTISSACPDLSDGSLDTLVARLDGWGAGIGIVANILATESESDPNRFAQHFSGRDRDIVDYFETEMMSGLDPADRDFLVRTSALVQPDGPASDALLQTRWSHERLARLTSSSMLVAASSDGRFRWMPLARDFLLLRLEQIGDGCRREQHERLLGYFRAEHRHSEAIAQAAELGNHECVVEIAGGAGLNIASSLEHGGVIEWLERVPADVIKQHSEVALTAAAALWFTHGDRAAALIDDWLSFAESAVNGGTITDAVSRESAICAARAAFVDADSDHRVRLAEKAFAIEGPAESSWAALAASAAGVSSYLADDSKAARRWLTEGLRIANKLGDTNQYWASKRMTGAALATLALIEADRGEFERGEAFVAAGYMSRELHNAERIGGGLAPLAKALHDLHRSPDGDCAQAIATLRDVSHSAKISQVGVLAHLEVVRVEATSGSTAAAAAEFIEVSRRIEQLDAPGRLIVRRYAAMERLLEQRTNVPNGTFDTELTEREEEVLRLLDSELTRREIGEHLYLAHNTIKTYVQRVYQKLGVSSRPAAIAVARKRGWL